MGMGRGAPKYPVNNFNKTNLSYPFEMFHNTLSKLRCTVSSILKQGFYILIFCDAIGTNTREIKRKLAILSLLPTTLFFSTRVRYRDSNHFQDFESVFKCPNNKIGIVRTIALKIYQPVY